MKPHLLLAAFVAISTSPALASPQIDARGVALLEREVARIKAFKSFSVEGRETVHRAGQVRNSTFRVSLQFPYRAWLQVEADRPIDEGDGGRRRILMGQKQLFTSVNDASATTQNIDSLSKRARAFVSVFRGAPSLIFSWMTLSARVNLADHPQTVSACVVRLRDGKTNLRNVIIQLKNQKSAAPLERYEFGFDARGRLRRSLARLFANGKPTTLVGHYKPVKSNWKGTQARTDALVYNWKLVAADAKIRLVVAPKKAIEARAQAILARAQKLYSSAQSLRFAWTLREGNKAVEKRELRFGRDGRLFVQGEFGTYSTLALDGQRKTQYSKARNEFSQTPVKNAREEVESQMSFLGVMDETLFVVAGQDPLNPQGMSIGARDFQTFRATVLPPQPFGGEACDLVRISRTGRTDHHNTPETEQQTFWFARKDGRLMRWQLRVLEEGQLLTQSDAQVSKQEFNPTWSAKDFAFSVPKNAERRAQD